MLKFWVYTSVTAGIIATGKSSSAKIFFPGLLLYLRQPMASVRRWLISGFTHVMVNLDLVRRWVSTLNGHEQSCFRRIL